jgi:hypothetical protein
MNIELRRASRGGDKDHRFSFPSTGVSHTSVLRWAAQLFFDR